MSRHVNAHRFEKFTFTRTTPTIMFKAGIFRAVAPRVTLIILKPFSTSAPVFRTNHSTRTKENVHDLKTFLTLIGRNTMEYHDTFEGDLQKFLKTSSKEMKNLGIDVQLRKYMLRWIHKFENDLEPLRVHRKGKKKHGGERKAKEVLAKKNALKRLEEKEKFKQEELEAENRGERDF